jgi:hypothetical protein
MYSMQWNVMLCSVSKDDGRISEEVFTDLKLS